MIYPADSVIQPLNNWALKDKAASALYNKTTVQVTQLYSFGFVGPFYNGSTLLRHYKSIFWGTKVVNEFYDTFRAARLKTVVCHTNWALQVFNS